ncbi:ATP-dependent zinc metalloprotease FtsH [Puniceicoccus vermicola]|uniref:ATP-dependent zinc metalloprotease FtsH n=1 Tax=Puniceicoccus vermicola TaxID=388746 RepID=A0A7X1B2Q6_9BACT|nr:ATP-dependent zinc metalloprotease FtsH [Puniceicoccus vermicola]MBC2603478.1 ATP-dependent zinc metalloprotease FtsH [Puniceicoccus vermicola]
MKEDKDRKTPQRPPQPDRFQPKVLMIWLGIIAAIFALYALSDSQRASMEKLSVPEVIQAVEANQIVSGTIKNDPTGGSEWYIISGEIAPDGDTAKQVEADASLKPERFEARGRLTEDDYTKIRAAFREEPASTFLTDLILNIVPFLLIIGLLYFLFIRQLRNAGRGAMSFGKSKAKMLTRDREKVVFRDVAGCDEAKEEVSEIVDFLKDPKRFQRIGGKIPKGVLMVGPPGTGKTLLAKAVAGEADVPFFTISGSDFVEMFVGVGAARVRDMFEQARKNSPCIIFIDEIDAVGRQRGAGLGGGNDEREQTLNSLLVEMDGFDGHEGIIVIAATNRPDVLDRALLRPGRFDRQVMIDPPDLNGREEILQVHARKIKLSKDIDLHVIARATPGFAGADLANLLNEGALIAARRSKKEVEMSDLDEAREKISFGRERRRLMDDEDKKITAYHEAGHAIVQAVIDDGHLPIHKVTIIPRGQSLGSTMFSPKKDILNQAKKRALNQICCAMGGRIAEDMVLDEITSGASGDIKMATKMARRMVCDWGMSELGPIAFGDNQDHIFLGKEISRDQNYSEATAQAIDKAIHDIVIKQYKRCQEILEEHLEHLHTLAAALLEHETVEGKHVHEIIDTGSIQSDVVQIEPVRFRGSKAESDEGKEKKSDEKSEDMGGGREPSGAPA